MTRITRVTPIFAVNLANATLVRDWENAGITE
jgi:hypothetical protein